MEIATFLSVAAGQFCHVSYLLLAAFLDFSSHQPVGHFPSGYQFYLAVSLRLTNSFEELPRGYPILGILAIKHN
jgi:hypothetical protein